jgi:hypothetical protein
VKELAEVGAGHRDGMRGQDREFSPNAIRVMENAARENHSEGELG